MKAKLCAVLLGLTVGFACAQQRVDPTQPQSYVGSAKVASETGDGASAPIVVSAVIIKDGKRLAVINGETLSQGQSYRGNQIKTIHKNGVVLMLQGRETELLVNQFTIKKDASNDF